MRRNEINVGAHRGKTSLTFIAQAGFVIESKSGTALGIDLYLSDCVERYDGFKRLSPKIMDPSTSLDFIIASHWHLDHFDIDAMPFLMSNQKTKLICARDCYEHVEKLNLDRSRVYYIQTGDTVQCNDIIVHAVFCDHGSGAPSAVGIVLKVDGYKIYFAGDTALRLDKAPEIAELGPFDVMIAPINGAFGNLTEKENVQLCAFHNPRLAIPCHFWTFAEQHGDPGIWMNLMKDKLTNQAFLVMAPGEELVLEEKLS